MASKIEWTEETWNPTVGCSIVSPGCHNCYAMRMAHRLEGMRRAEYDGLTTEDGRWTGVVRTLEERLEQPLRWKKPRRVFVDSMSDLFHEDVPTEFIARVFATMYQAQWHTFQVLTKRADRMRLLLTNPRFAWAVGVAAWKMMAAAHPEKAEIVTRDEVVGDVMEMWPLRNVWLGVSVEDQMRANERIPDLLRTPSAVRFLSCEPLLGPVDLDGLWGYPFCATVEQLDAWPIQWVIVGGESGSKARRCEVRYVRHLIAQCKAARVPTFVKQLGSVVNDMDGTMACSFPERQCWPQGTRSDGQKILLRDTKGGDWSEWPKDLRVREFPDGHSVNQESE